MLPYCALSMYLLEKDDLEKSSEATQRRLLCICLLAAAAAKVLQLQLSPHFVSECEQK